MMSFRKKEDQSLNIPKPYVDAVKGLTKHYQSHGPYGIVVMWKDKKWEYYIKNSDGIYSLWEAKEILWGLRAGIGD